MNQKPQYPQLSTELLSTLVAAGIKAITESAPDMKTALGRAAFELSYQIRLREAEELSPDEALDRITHSILIRLGKNKNSNASSQSVESGAQKSKVTPTGKFKFLEEPEPTAGAGVAPQQSVGVKVPKTTEEIMADILAFGINPEAQQEIEGTDSSADSDANITGTKE